MTIADLFVNIGVKGDGSLNKSLKGVKSGMADTKSMALEMKVAILAAIVAFERMMSASGKAGQGLLNFEAATGLSMKTLQQYQYAGQQVGLTNDDVASSIKGVQAAMVQVAQGGSAPVGLSMVKDKVGLDFDKALDPSTGPLYVMQQLQKFSQQVRPDIAKGLVGSFGVSEGVFAGMRQNAFNPEVMNKAPAYSEGQAKQLGKSNAAWANLGQKVEMAFGKFNAKHGLKMVEDISKIADQVFRLIDGLTQLADKLGVFEKLGKIVGFFADAAESKPGTVMGEKHLEKKIIQFFKGGLEDSANHQDPYTEFQKTPIKPIWDKSHLAPRVQPSASPKSTTTNTTVNQNMNFQHDGKDHRKTAESTKKAVHAAYRISSAQVQIV